MVLKFYGIIKLYGIQSFNQSAGTARALNSLGGGMD